MNIQHSFIWLLVYLHISNNIRGTFLFFFTHFAWFSVEFFKIGMLRVMNIHSSFPSQWNICLIIGPAHKEKVALSDSSARDENRSVMTKRWKKSTFLFMILNENLISQKPINQCGSVREDLCTPGRGERDNVAFYRNTGSF